MMYARIRLARKTRIVLLPPLFVLPCLSENFQSPGAGPLHTAEHHRPGRILTGTPEFSSAFYWIHRHSRDCRSAPNSAGRQKLPAEDNLTANREQTVHGMGFSGTCGHGCASYHVLNSKKHDPRSLSHQWSMMTQGIKFATQCKDACNKQNEIRSLIMSKSKAPVTENQGTLHHLEYECPLTLIFGLTPQAK